MDIGATLRHAREDRGLTLDTLSRVTRITLPILTAIERNDRLGIPPPPYGRGFVRAYASEVGLNPDEMASAFFLQFAPPSEPAPPPPKPRVVGPFNGMRDWRLGPLAGVGMVLAAVAIAWLMPRPERTAAPGMIGTAGRTAPRARVERVAGLSGTLRGGETRGLTVVLEATAPSWVTAHADGRRMLYRTVLPGERQVLRAERNINLRVGDAGAIRWRVGENPPAPMGKPGEVRTVRLRAPDQAH